MLFKYSGNVWLHIKNCLQITFSGHTRIFTGPNGWSGGPFGPPVYILGPSAVFLHIISVCV